MSTLIEATIKADVRCQELAMAIDKEASMEPTADA